MKNNKLINRFYRDYNRLHKIVEDAIDDKNNTYIASRILNRVIVIIFIRENLLDSELVNNIANKFAEGKNLFNILLDFYNEPYRFVGYDNLETEIITSLFKVNEIEKSIIISDDIIIEIFNTFDKYQWSLLSSSDDEYITPDILGNVFEKYINQSENGAYYTDKDTIDYINTNTILYALFNKLNYKEKVLNGIINIIEQNKCSHKNRIPNNFHEIIQFNYNIFELMIEFILMSDDIDVILDIQKNLRQITIMDITVGTGAFILHSLDILLTLHKTILKSLNKFQKWEIPSDLELTVFIIENNLYGLDIMNDAIEIARFRLYLRVFLESIRSNIKLEKGVKVNLEVGNALIDESIYDKFHNYTLDNGFDCIVGNPPYVEYSKIRKQYEVDNMKTIKCGNIYAYIIEKSLNLLKDNGTIGVIAPISLVSTPRMYPLRRFIEQNCKTMFFSNFADRPSSLFNGVHQKVTIFIGEKESVDNPKIYTSQYYHWYKEERKDLFRNIKYIENNFKNKKFYYKIENNLQKSIIEKVNSIGSSILDMTVKESNWTAYLNTRLTFWVKCFSKSKVSNEFKEYYFDSLDESLIFMAIMNSNLYFFIWETISDGWHITNKELEMFKFDYNLLNNEDKKKLINLALKLEKDLEAQKLHVGTKQTKYEYRHKKSKLIIDEIDLILKDYYKFTQEEYNYIIDYNLKYRLNDEFDCYLNERGQV